MFVQNLLVRSPGASLVSCALVLLAACGSINKKEPASAEPVGVAVTTPAAVPVTTSASTATEPKAAPAIGGTKSASVDVKKVHTIKAKSAEPPAFAAVFGPHSTWKIDGHVFPGISAMDEREASALHGSYVMSYSSLVTPWERCDGPVSAAREATVEEWFASYDARELDDTDRMTFHTKPGAKVMVHDLSCKDATQLEIVQLAPDQIAIARDGVIFTATRVR